MSVPSPREIEEKVTDIEVENVREPEKAQNNRGNPDAEVAVVRMGVPVERYCVEFHQLTDGEYNPRHRAIITGVSEEADVPRYHNRIIFKAAKAFTERTETDVDIRIRSVNTMKEEREQYS